MKTAVVYYSMSGNTRQTAEKIAEKLGADLIRIEPVREYPSKGFRKFLWGGKSAVMGDTPALRPYRFDDGYERIVFGTPLWAGVFSPQIRSFIWENQSKLTGKRFAAFVCCAGGNAERRSKRFVTSWDRSENEKFELVGEGLDPPVRAAKPHRAMMIHSTADWFVTLRNELLSERALIKQFSELFLARRDSKTHDRSTQLLRRDQCYRHQKRTFGAPQKEHP